MNHLPPSASASEGFPLPPLEPITPENVGRIEQLARLGDGVIRDSRFSPDGDTLAVASSIGLWLYDMSDDEGRLLEGQDGVESIAYNPNGQFIASGGSDGSIIIWDIASGTGLFRTLAHLYRVTNLMYSPDGTLIMSRDISGVIRIWETSSGRDLFITVIEGRGIRQTEVVNPPPLSSIHWLDTHNTTLQLDGDSILVDVPPVRLIGAIRDFISAAFAPDRALVVGGSLDNHLYLWDVRTLPEPDPIVGALPIAPIAILEGHTMGVTGVAFNEDGTLLASSSYDGTIRLWGVRAND